MMPGSVVSPLTRRNFRRILGVLGGSPTSLRAKLAHNTAWSLCGLVIARVLALGTSICVARMLGAEKYGEFGIVQSTIGLFGSIAGFGMAVTATKYVAEYCDSAPDKAGRIIGITTLLTAIASVVMAVVLFITAPWLAVRTLHAPHVAAALRISSLLLLVTAIGTAQTGILSGVQAFKSIAWINAITGAVGLPFMLLGVAAEGVKGGIWAAAMAQLFGLVTAIISMRRVLRDKKIRIHLGRGMQEWNVIWKFSFPALLSSVMIGPVYWVCTSMLVRAPDGFRQMGIFNAANQWFTALLVLPSVLGQALLPLLSESSGRDNSDVRSLTILSLKVNAIVVTPFVFIGCAMSPIIMSMYGFADARSAATLCIVLVTGGLLAIQTPIGQIITAMGRMWLGASMNLGWAFAFIISTALLVHAGSLGIAGGRLIAYMAHACWTAIFALYVLRRRNYDEAMVIG